MRNKLFIALNSILILVSCETSTIETNNQNTIVDVYAAGNKFNESYESRAFFWKNNNLIFLTTEENISEANSVFVLNNNIYVGGCIYNNFTSKACYWKNGQFYALSDDFNFNATVTDIKVVNGSVYASGYDNGLIVYWKDGIKTILTNTITGGSEPKIEVIENDIYINGEMRDGTVIKPVYWKNGVVNYLSTYEGHTSDIEVKNNDVYVVGDTFYSANDIRMYWKNNVPNPIYDAANLHSIAISNTNDVYLCGMDYDTKSCYWKNEVKTIVNQETGNILYDIKLLNSLIFSCGLSDSFNNSMVLINGVLIRMSNDRTELKSIFVVQK